MRLAKLPATILRTFTLTGMISTRLTSEQRLSIRLIK